MEYCDICVSYELMNCAALEPLIFAEGEYIPPILIANCLVKLIPNTCGKVMLGNSGESNIFEGAIFIERHLAVVITCSQHYHGDHCVLYANLVNELVAPIHIPGHRPTGVGRVFGQVLPICIRPVNPF